MADEKKLWHNGSCHCGVISFQARAPKNAKLTKCNCSICSMTGFLHLIIAKEDFRLLSGADNITTYTFNSKTARHTFCKTCGIKPFYRPRSHPDGYSVNFNCLDKSGFANIQITEFDGQNWSANIENLLKE